VLLVVSLVAGCSGIDVSEATRLSAFRPDGTGPAQEVTEEDAQNIQENGVVFEFQKGDILTVNVVVNGDVAELVEETPVEIRLKEKLYVYAGSEGMFFSRDGEEFHEGLKLFKGSLAINMSIKKETKKNELNVILKGAFRS
jgi:hypothetical protein